MEMIAMLGGLSTGTESNPMELDAGCQEKALARILSTYGLTMQTVPRGHLSRYIEKAQAACSGRTGLVAPPPIKSAGVTAPADTSPDTVKLVSVFAVGAVLGFFLGRGNR